MATHAGQPTPSSPSRSTSSPKTPSQRTGGALVDKPGQTGLGGVADVLCAVCGVWCLSGSGVGEDKGVATVVLDSTSQRKTAAAMMHDLHLDDETGSKRGQHTI